jgi:hypothetical protein
LDLTIELTDVLTPDSTAALCASRAQSLLICDRCQNVEEVVVAIMKIVPLDETLALCGTCTRELPAGFNVA